MDLQTSSLQLSHRLWQVEGSHNCRATGMYSNCMLSIYKVDPVPNADNASFACVCLLVEEHAEGGEVGPGLSPRVGFCKNIKPYSSDSTLTLCSSSPLVKSHAIPARLDDHQR